MGKFDELISEYEQKKFKRVERLRKFLQYSESTKDLYSSLGYSEYFDTKSDVILFTLKSLVAAKITNIEGFYKYRKKLIKIKNVYDEDPAAYEELWPQPDNEYMFLSANDYEFIERIEIAGDDNQEAYEEIICDPNNHYFLYGLPFEFKDIAYKYKDLIKAQKLFDELISLYKYSYLNTNGDKEDY